MGRTVYSQTYALPEPVIHAEPEPNPTCERWTSWSHFDPDSEEFFQDAEYEAFIYPAQSAREQAAEISAAALAPSPTGMSDLSDSSSSEGSMGELERQREGRVAANNSPMAVGSDDPAMLIADAYTNRTSRWTALIAGGDFEGEAVTPLWQSVDALDGVARESNYFSIGDSPVQTTPAFIPSPSIRSASPLRSPTLRRMAPTPITITRTRTRVEHRDTDPEPPIERTPSPVSPAAPATPPPTLRLQPPHRMRPALATPSPPPSVTPRFYSWQQHAIPAVPVSPTAGREREREREGPLTNPLARMSFVRIDAGPTRVRIPNTVM